MTMNDKIAHFAENYGNAFFVGSLTQEKTIYVNKTARELFGVTAETCDYEKIFSYKNNMLRSFVVEHFDTVGEPILNETIVTTAEGKKIRVDLQIGFFDSEKTEIYMEMILRKDTSKVMAEFQVDKSLEPEAIFELDKELTLIHCNDHFFALFDSSIDTFPAKYHCKLSNTFKPNEKECFIEEIQQSLKNGSHYKRELQIITETGNTKWVSLLLQKRVVDESGTDKVMASLTNIDDKVDALEKVSTLEQYMSSMQQSTTDLLYRVDLETMTLYHSSDFTNVHVLDKEIPDYINTFLNGNIIHPEDKEQYLKNLEEFKRGGEPQTPIRFSLESKEYQYYKITGKFVYDCDGNPKEVLGALINVHKEHIMEQEFSSLNQYFNVFQSISGESFFTIDVKNKVLIQRGQVAEELDLVGKINNFPETVYHKVHPDDLEEYKTFTNGSLEGIAGSIQIRVKTKKGDYQWYGINSGIVRNEQGEVQEVVGRMNNIHKEKNLERENSTLNQYYEAVRSLSGESLYVVDIKTKTLHSHGITKEELGLPTEVKDYPRSIYELIYPDDLENYKSFSTHSLDGTESLLTLRIKNKDRHYQWYELNSMVIRDEQGNPVEVLGKIRNIQQQKDLEARASHDLMTKVLNKVTFEESVAHTFKTSAKGKSHALIFIDLDDFKGINDTYGHDFGDFLLTTVGKRLKRVVRENDLIGRIGGDEFAVMLKSIGDKDAAQVRVNLLLETLQRPFSYEGNTVEIKASIGVSIFPKHGNNYKELIKKSDIALYCSKAKGKNVATIYSEELEEY